MLDNFTMRQVMDVTEKLRVEPLAELVLGRWSGGGLRSRRGWIGGDGGEEEAGATAGDDEGRPEAGGPRHDPERRRCPVTAQLEQ